MNQDERRRTTREHIENGGLTRSSGAVPRVPGQGVEVGRVTVCRVPHHRCAGCGEDKPDVEMVGKKMCFHNECRKEWMENCRPGKGRVA